MSRFGTKPDKTYATLPLRRIVSRWTEYSDPRYPSPMMTLECGHSGYYRGQKLKARCGECGREAKALLDSCDPSVLTDEDRKAIDGLGDDLIDRLVTRHEASKACEGGGR